MSAGITVVVPVRDGARYLPAALDSLWAQTVPPDAIVVADDGCADDSADLARAAGATVIRVGEPEAAVGCGAGRNAGAAIADTPLLTFMDADDIAPPDRFAIQLAALEADPSLDGVLGHVEQFLSPDREAELAGRYAVPDRPMAGWHAGALLIARERFLATDGWAEDQARHEAFEWFAAAREQGLRLKMLDDVVLRRRIHGDNDTLRHRDDLHARYLESARAAIRRRTAAS